MGTKGCEAFEKRALGRKHCIVSLGKTLYSQSASLHPGVGVLANCWGNLKPKNLRASDLRWTSIPSRESRNTPSRFTLQKPG